MTGINSIKLMMISYDDMYHESQRSVVVGFVFRE